MSPIHLVLYITFGILGLVLMYAAFTSSNDIRSRATCQPGYKQVMEDKCTTVGYNRNNEPIQSCHKEPTCKKKTTNLMELQQENKPKPKPTKTPKPKTLQEEKKKK